MSALILFSSSLFSKTSRSSPVYLQDRPFPGPHMYSDANRHFQTTSASTARTYGTSHFLWPRIWDLQGSALEYEVLGYVGETMSHWHPVNRLWKYYIFRNFVSHWHRVKSFKLVVVGLFTHGNWRTLHIGGGGSFLLETGLLSIDPQRLAWGWASCATSSPKSMCSAYEHCHNRS